MLKNMFDLNMLDLLDEGCWNLINFIVLYVMRVVNTK